MLDSYIIAVGPDKIITEYEVRLWNAPYQVTTFSG